MLRTFRSKKWTGKDGSSKKMENNLSIGAYSLRNRSFYGEVIKYLKEGDVVLNLGCGNFFRFERLTKKVKDVSFISIDIIKVKEIPDFVDEYIYQSVEEPFKLKKKFDVVTFFELIEHLDKTDILLENCYNNLREGGLLIFSFPNLSSIICRLALLLGYQPYMLEVSNIRPDFGGGLIARMNNPKGIASHHIRGFTYKAMTELIKYHGFTVEKTFSTKYKLLSYFPSLATEVVFVCKKGVKDN